MEKEGSAVVTIVRGERVGRQGRIAVGCSAAVLDARTETLLLIRRADNGRWSVPGGYMDPGESLTEACAREVREETGLQVRVGPLLSVYTSPHILLEYPDGNRWQLVILYFSAEAIGGEVRPGEEATEVGYFSQAEIEALDLSDLDRQRVEDAFARREGVSVWEDVRL
jgi:ADP-ribose pyrophosphatase YjhB (NUDIX family)